jgi:hypothetical protein
MPESWRIASASVAGSSHVRDGRPCQDAHDCRVLDLPRGPALLAIASDGAGSAPRSELGAGIAVREIGAAVREVAEAGLTARQLDIRLARALYGRVADAIAAEALRAGGDPKDYACTLLAAYVDESGGAFLQVGDGAAVIRMEGGDAWRPALWPQHGEYANETNFVVGPSVGDDVEAAYVEGRIAEVALFTDGLENLVLDKAARTAPAPFFEHVAAPVRRLPAPGRDEALSAGLAAYLSSKDFTARTDDDVTLVVASRA